MEGLDCMNQFSRITHDIDIMGGKACISGTRVTVGMIIAQLGEGKTAEVIVDEYPYLSVSHSEQRQGVGSKLVTAVLHALDNEGIHKVALVVKNVAGNVFWEKQGFTVREDLIYRNKIIKEISK